MRHETLGDLVSTQRHLPRGVPAAQAALAILPELADGMPAVIPDSRGARILSACHGVLRPLVAGVVAEASASAGAADIADLARRLELDPLVAAVANLSREGLAVSRGAAVVPFLQVLAHSAAAATNTGGAPEVRARVAVAILARLGAACARLVNEGVDVPALAPALANARAASVFLRGDPMTDPSPAAIAALLGSPVNPPLVEAAIKAAQVAVAAVLSRRAAGKSTADDAPVVLRHLAPGLLDAGVDTAGRALSTDPDALAYILPALARLTDAKALAAVRIDAALAKRLLEPEVGVAVAGALGDAFAELRRWDVVSLLCAALLPCPDRLAHVAVPRGVAGRGTVVAIGLGRLRSDAARDPARLLSVADQWGELTSGVRGFARDEGHLGLVVFDDALDALRFALRARTRLGNAVSVGMGAGVLVGGSDGGGLRVAGPAVDTAVRWVATGATIGVGAVAPQTLGHVGGWLAGAGIGVDAAADHALQEARTRHGLGADGAPGGDTRTPRGLDLHRVFELDGGVVALVRVAGVAGGFELLFLAPDEWRRMLDRAPAPAAGARPAPHDSAPHPEIIPTVAAGPEWDAPDAFGEPEETDEGRAVMLDLDEATAMAPATEPRIDFEEPLPLRTAEPQRRAADPSPGRAPRGGFGRSPLGRPEPAVQERSSAGVPRRSAETLPAPDAGVMDEADASATGFFLPGVGAVEPDHAFDMEVTDDEPSAPDESPLATSDDPFGEPDPETEQEPLDLFADPFAGGRGAGSRATEHGRRADSTASDDPFASSDPFATADPFASDKAGRSADPFAADPFASADPFEADPFGGADPFGAADPFAPKADSFPPKADSFAPKADPFAEEADPFGSHGGAFSAHDPFPEPVARLDAVEEADDAFRDPFGGDAPPDPFADPPGSDEPTGFLTAPGEPTPFGFELADDPPAADGPDVEVDEPDDDPATHPGARGSRDAVPPSDDTPARDVAFTEMLGLPPPGSAASTPPVSTPPASTPPVSTPPAGSPARASEPAGRTTVASERSAQTSGTRAHQIDFGFLLKGYASFVAGNEIIFGRPYGARVVDRHAYPHKGDADAAYRRFLQDKITEGFVPRTELMGDLPTGTVPTPLDMERLNRVWQGMP